MSWIESMRRLSRLTPFTVLLAAAACGGDKNPTGPADPTGPGGGGEPVQFQLVALGRAGLPADVEVEDCTLTRFYGGSIKIDPATGQWQISLKVHDKNYGDWGYKDEGGSEGDGTTVFFDSQISGTSHEATVNADGTEVKIMYDWCENGVADVQLVFDR
jgi:hypothetical protein